jgi:hypothetical protein
MNTKTVFLSVMALWAGMNVALGQDQRRVTIMSYNVENLFDTEDNPSREGDNTYLPRSQKGTPEHIALCERTTDPGSHRQECLNLDWSEQVLAKKLQNIATVIGRFEDRGPDILLLQEVENQGIANRLRSLLPNPETYQTVLNLDDSPGHQRRAYEPAATRQQ